MKPETSNVLVTTESSYEAHGGADNRDSKRTLTALLAAAGVFAATPAAAQVVCDMVRGKEGKAVKMQMMRAMPQCLNPDGNVGPIGACTQVAPISAEHHFGPSTKVSLSFKSGKEGDVTVKYSASGLLATDNQAPSQGDVYLQFTTVLTVEDEINGPTRTVPFNIEAPANVQKGSLKGELSLGQLIEAEGLGALPDCFLIEIEEVTLLDGAMSPIAVGGTNPLFSERDGTAFGTRG